MPTQRGHKHCKGDDPPPDPESTLEMCPVELCIASVGKWHGVPAREYAEDSLHPGNYTEISSSRFSEILGTLPDGDAKVLCDAYHVLIVNWASPKINNLDWKRLLDYMECGGGVIFEDPSNVGALADGVSTFEVALKSKGETPLSITLEPVTVLTLGAPLNGETPLDFINKHIIFDEGTSDNALMPFLYLENGDVVGLYGQFSGGRIVLTGPDNNYHGRLDGQSDPVEKENHYNLLWNEINWLLE